MSDGPLEQKLKTALAHLNTVNLFLSDILPMPEARALESKHRRQLIDLRTNLRRQSTILRRLLSDIYKITGRRLSSRDALAKSASGEIDAGKW